MRHVPPGSFVLRLCSTLTFVPYFSLDPASSHIITYGQRPFRGLRRTV